MSATITIADRVVGPDYPPLVIAEIGINHEGEYDKAIRLIDAACESGAEVIKFQCHIAEEEMLDTGVKPEGISTETLWNIIKRCELTESEERELQEYSMEKGLIYLSTPFSRAAADRLNDIGVPAFKIGSGECNNLPLIDHIAQMGKPIILSTGMNDLDSIRLSVDTILAHNTPFALLHCTSMYPTPYEKVRLGAIGDLQTNFPEAVVGVSDHSMNIWTCLGAVSLGASILEKHFTVSRDWPGPDTGISIEPDELADLIEGSNAVWQARGGSKSILSEEQPVIDFAYASIVTIQPIKKGDTLTLDNIWVKRPGTGPIHAREFHSYLGRVSACDLPADVFLDEVAIVARP
jgi:sialic acid synthase SpsE